MATLFEHWNQMSIGPADAQESTFRRSRIDFQALKNQLEDVQESNYRRSRINLPTFKNKVTDAQESNF